MQDQPIRYSVCTSADVDEMVALLARVFAEREPPSVAVDLSPPEFASFIRLYCPKVAADGISIVARAATTGDMVGALLADDMAVDPPDGLDRLSPKFDPVFDILIQLDEEYREGRSFRPGEGLHLFFLGVDAAAVGQGVARQLVAECLANGMRRGYRLAVTEATSKTSQHIFRKLGFVERVRRSYRDHRFAGQSFFASIADHGGPVLMDKSLE